MTIPTFRHAYLFIEHMNITDQSSQIDAYGRKVQMNKRARIWFQLNDHPYTLDCFQNSGVWNAHQAAHQLTSAVCPYCGSRMDREPSCSYLHGYKHELFAFLKENKQLRLKLLML